MKKFLHNVIGSATLKQMALPNPNPIKTPVGVLYFPFQTASVISGHTELLTLAFYTHDIVIVALPVSKISPSKTSPLFFAERREMIETYCSVNFDYKVVVIPVPERKYDKDRISQLHNAVSAPFHSLGAVTLYAPDEYIEMYTANGGTWNTSRADLRFSTSVLAQEAEHRKSTKADSSELCDSAEAFRRGIIFAQNQRFPISWMTVDIAIRRVIDGKTMYLLGKKPGERNWRFPGGFKDRSDTCLEMSVIREAAEEVLNDTVTVASGVFTEPIYVASRNINDWRYRNEDDGITTVFFEVTFMGDDDQLCAGDDLAGESLQWHDINLLDPTQMEGEHAHLLKALKDFHLRRA